MIPKLCLGEMSDEKAWVKTIKNSRTALFKKLCIG